MEKVIVNMDTNVIEANTADNLAVYIQKEVPRVEKEINVGGQIVKGDNLVVVESRYCTLGNIKERIADIDTYISEMQAERAKLVADLALVTPEVDKAIALKQAVSEPVIITK